MFAGPMEKQILDNWHKIMQSAAVTNDERKILDQWINNTLKTGDGAWFADPGTLQRPHVCLESSES